jgi:hypothetical protein
VVSTAPRPRSPRHARPEVVEARETGGDGLPRRIRQNNLAPQLKETPPDAVTVEDATPAAPARSPEQLRAMMTSFQRGMNKGRRDADAATDQLNGGAERDAQ